MDVSVPDAAETHDEHTTPHRSLGGHGFRVGVVMPQCRPAVQAVQLLCDLRLPVFAFADRDKPPAAQRVSVVHPFKPIVGEPLDGIVNQSVQHPPHPLIAYIGHIRKRLVHRQILRIQVQGLNHPAPEPDGIQHSDRCAEQRQAGFHICFLQHL